MLAITTLTVPKQISRRAGQEDALAARHPQLGDSDDDPDRLALDLVNHEIFVPQEDYILVFDRRANGDVAPRRRTYEQSTKAQNTSRNPNCIVRGP